MGFSGRHNRLRLHYKKRHLKDISRGVKPTYWENLFKSIFWYW